MPDVCTYMKIPKRIDGMMIRKTDGRVNSGLQGNYFFFQILVADLAFDSWLMYGNNLGRSCKEKIQGCSTKFEERHPNSSPGAHILVARHPYLLYLSILSSTPFILSFMISRLQVFVKSWKYV